MIVADSEPQKLGHLNLYIHRIPTCTSPSTHFSISCSLTTLFRRQLEHQMISVAHILNIASFSIDDHYFLANAQLPNSFEHYVREFVLFSGLIDVLANIIDPDLLKLDVL